MMNLVKNCIPVTRCVLCRSTCEVSRFISTDSEKMETFERGEVINENPSNEEYFRAICQESNLDTILGRPVFRSTRLEAAVRRLADNLMIYDTIDKFLLSDEFKQFDDPNKSELSPVIVDHDLLQSTDKSLLSKAHTYFIKEYNSSSLNHSQYATTISDLDYALPIYSQSSKENMHNRLGTYVQKYLNRDSFLPGLCDLILESTARQDIKLFSRIIVILLASGYVKPAEMTLDCIIASNLPMDRHMYYLAIRTLVRNSSKQRFIEVARLLNLQDNNYNNPRFTSMSQEWVRGQSTWFPSTPYYKNLAERFFGSGSPELCDAVDSICEGLYRFSMHQELDLCLREFIMKSGILPISILLINFKVARRNKDGLRSSWTWDQFLLYFDEKPKERLEKLKGERLFFVLAYEAALASNTTELCTKIVQFTKKHRLDFDLRTLKEQAQINNIT